MNIISYEQLEKSKLNETLNGILYLRYLIKTTSTKGTIYLLGEVENQEKFQVVMWSSCSQFKTFETGLANVFINASFVIGEFAGKKSLILNNINVIDENIMKLDASQFIKHKYDTSQYELALLECMKNNISTKAYSLYLDIIEHNVVDGVWSRFIKEYAAQVNHDNCESGLLAHTYKCIRILDFLLKPYGILKSIKTPEYTNPQDTLDLLFLSVALHDVGKVYEMKDGLHQKDSFNTHRVLGLEVLFKQKDKIIDAYGNHGYQLLISVIVGHHDKYGENAKSLFSYITYLIDNIDSTFTSLEQLLNTNITEKPEGSLINWNNKSLFI